LAVDIAKEATLLMCIMRDSIQVHDSFGIGLGEMLSDDVTFVRDRQRGAPLSETAAAHSHPDAPIASGFRRSRFKTTNQKSHQTIPRKNHE
jgi:hypothetical protein